MLCCLCGKKISLNDKFLKIIPFELNSSATGKLFQVQSTMEDGSEQKIACYLCPVLFGAPRDLIGATNERLDC